ncbi:MAG TPA: nuclear transport factor 2 family protein [Pyrinomonadaceae bacterium]|jgi:ketosteroid isomerase-like protein|nr:nuclear transport factor 2 family protein [Pyrinomonadaceae bacterium]
MKKTISATISFALIALFAGNFSGCSTQPNSNANTVATASAEPTPDKTAIEAQLKALEYDWPRIIKERDGAAVRKLEADDVVLIEPNGSLGAKDADIKDIESGEMANDPQEISDVVVNVLDNDSAVVISRTTVKGDSYKISDDKGETIIHEFRTLDTFMRRNGQWQIVASATVPVRTPVSPESTPSAAAASPTSKGSPAARASSPPKAAPPMMQRSPE